MRLEAPGKKILPENTINKMDKSCEKRGYFKNRNYSTTTTNDHNETANFFLAT